MEHNKAMQLRTPSQGERFKWFAISHFSISSIGVIGMFASTLLDGAMLAALFLWEGVLLALYVFAGAWIARKRVWCKPQRARDGVQAFLFPTLVAWIWGGLFLVILCVPAVRFVLGDTGDILAIFLMNSLLILAFPSSLGFIMLLLFVGGLDAAFTLIWSQLLAFMLIVGAVPPLLFLLGSVFGVRKISGEELSA